MKFRRYKEWMKVIAFSLALSFVIGISYSPELIRADRNQDLQNDRDKLDDIEDQIDNIKDSQDDLEDEMASAEAQLASLMEKQEALKDDIDTTQADIDQTAIDLEIAKEEAEAQYQAMVLRIQYMYENSTVNSFWEALLEADGISDFLTRVEYITTIHQADQELTDEYTATVAEVAQKEEDLRVKMDELLMKQEIFLGQQAEVESLLADLEESHSQYASQLAEAETQAEKYRASIAKREEEIRKEQQQQQGNKPSYDYSNQGNPNVTGTELVNFALQFVGNPYVWGGNSLTNGCDCSGFVNLVYKQFGYKTCRYSLAFADEGRAVDCVSGGQADTSMMKPGDIVVYSAVGGVGHVGIYMGNGCIVEAQSSKAGITSNRNVNCRNIIAVRRVLPNP